MCVQSDISTVDGAQFVSIGERISFKALQERLHSYQVMIVEFGAKSVESPGFVISSADLQVHVTYDWKKNKIESLSTYSEGVFDTEGNSVGGDAATAVGEFAKCQQDELVICRGKNVKTLFYAIENGGDGECASLPKRVRDQVFRIEHCRKIAGIFLKVDR